MLQFSCRYKEYIDVLIYLRATIMAHNYYFSYDQEKLFSSWNYVHDLTLNSINSILVNSCSVGRRNESLLAVLSCTGKQPKPEIGIEFCIASVWKWLRRNLFTTRQVSAYDLSKCLPFLFLFSPKWGVAAEMSIASYFIFTAASAYLVASF